MEEVINNVEKVLLSPPWFQNKNESIETNTNINKPSPLPTKRLRFNEVGTVYYFDNREPPSKIPHYTSDCVKKLAVKMTSDDNKQEEIQDEILLEEKAEELKKKKQEEKYVKITEPLDEEEDEFSRPSWEIVEQLKNESIYEVNKDNFDIDGRISYEENKGSLDSVGRNSD